MLHATVCWTEKMENMTKYHPADVRNTWIYWTFYQVQKEILFQRNGGQSFCMFIGIHEICDNINRLLCEYSDKIRTIYVQKVASIDMRIRCIVCNLISMKRCCWRFNLHECVNCIVHIWKMQCASCKIALITMKYYIQRNFAVEIHIFDRTMWILKWMNISIQRTLEMLMFAINYPDSWTLNASFTCEC